MAPVSRKRKGKAARQYILYFQAGCLDKLNQDKKKGQQERPCREAPRPCKYPIICLQVTSGVKSDHLNKPNLP